MIARSYRLPIALIVVPPLGATAFIFGIVALSPPAADLPLAFLSLPVFCVLFYIGTLLGGLPVFLILERRRQHRFYLYLAAGFMIATVATIPLGMFPNEAIEAGASGMLTAGIFWLVARPDRNA